MAPAARFPPALLLLLVLAPSPLRATGVALAPAAARSSSAAHTTAAAPWPRVSITDAAFGAVGDNETDNTAAIRAALAFVGAAGGGEVVVPAPGVFKTGPMNLTSNVRLTVEGTLFGIEDARLFPRVADLPSYDDMNPRCHPLVWAVHATNVSVAGHGVINGAGPWWWPTFVNGTARPHLLEAYNVSGLTLLDVTMLNSAFWTLHPVYSRDVVIRGINITTPWCSDYKCANTDGIDVDSTVNVLIEHNYISCGDDHVTVISGAGVKGRAFAMPSRNVTVRYNTLGTGMGLSVGSSVSGGVEDVTYQFNTMTEDARDWGQGMHIKTASARGGYVRNIAYLDNVFNVVSTGTIEIETDYQSGGECNATSCTEIRDIVFRNITSLAGSPGSLSCFPERPCVNVTLENVHILPADGTWSCNNVTGLTVIDVSPPGLEEACAA